MSGESSASQAKRARRNATPEGTQAHDAAWATRAPHYVAGPDTSPHPIGQKVSSPNPPRPKSIAIFRQAQQLLPGGVDSPVRAFRAVGGEPLIIERASGSRLFDADGREYLDYISSWGALILGHAHPQVTGAIAAQARQGTSYGMTSPLEVELAAEITRAIPGLEMLRFVSSGTEAAMSAVRLARAFTRRDLFLKFEGCYHGHSDGFLADAGSGLATLGISACPGVPAASSGLTLNVPYNDVDAVDRIFSAHPKNIAAVIVEPVAANMGVVPPQSGYLAALREITSRYGTLLIFDEVITGFRLTYGGAQNLFAIAPDLTILGKIIGGGLPVAAYGGRRDIMHMVAPLGPVYQAGTLSGNPLAMRAGLATLPLLRQHHFYENLNRRAERLAAGLRQAAQDAGIAAQVNAAGSLLTLFFSDSPVRNYADAKKADTRRFASFFAAMLAQGILLPPSQFEALFLSAALTDQDIHRTIAAARHSLSAV